MEIIGKTPNDAWKKAVKYIMKEGVDFKDENNRICREVLNLTITIIEPEKEPDKPLQKIKQLKEFIYPSKQELEYAMLSKEKNPASQNW